MPTPATTGLHAKPAPGAPASTPAPRSRRLRRRWKARLSAARTRLAARIDPAAATPDALDAPGFGGVEGAERSGAAGVVPVSAEDALWLRAHRDHPIPSDLPHATTLVFADHDLQQWATRMLTEMGYTVTEPVMLCEGWVPARGEKFPTGQSSVVFTTPSATAAKHAARASSGSSGGSGGSAWARRSDPQTSQDAAAVVAANQHITAASHMGRLLLTYWHHHQTHPGEGLTAAAAVEAAGIQTDGAHGSPWHRVTDLRDIHGLLAPLLDASAARVTRKNASNSEGGVNVITPLGIRAATALDALRGHGFDTQPLLIGSPTEPTLFEDLATTLARVTAVTADTVAPAEATETSGEPGEPGEPGESSPQSGEEAGA